jgi:hypothetical protein
MKRVLAIVLGLCLLSGLSVNADIDTIEGSTIAGGGDTLQQENVATPDNTLYFGRGNIVYAVVNFTATSSYTMTELRMSPTKTGSGGSCTVNAILFNSDGSSELAASTNTHASSSFDGSELTWSFSGYSIENSTTYRIGLDAVSGSCADTSNYPQFQYTNTGDNIVYYNNGSWSEFDNSAEVDWEIWGN